MSVRPEILDKESRVGGQGQSGNSLVGDMECNKVIKVIIWCDIQSGVVFSPHMDPNSLATGRGRWPKFIWTNGHKCLLQFWPYSLLQ